MAEINVTPFVDVMLVLLIIFMVTAPLLTAGVPVNLPDSRAKPLDQEQQPIQIAIDERGQIFVDQQQVLEAALPGSLQTIAERDLEDNTYKGGGIEKNYLQTVFEDGEVVKVQTFEGVREIARQQRTREPV